MTRAGHVVALMKGSLHTDELMAAVVPSAPGLRTARRISHVFVLDVPTYPPQAVRPSSLEGTGYRAAAWHADGTLEAIQSFITEEDIFALIEGMLARVFKAARGVEIPVPFERITWREAMDRYGSDKPERRRAQTRRPCLSQSCTRTPSVMSVRSLPPLHSAAPRPSLFTTMHFSCWWPGMCGGWPARSCAAAGRHAGSPSNRCC